MRTLAGEHRARAGFRLLDFSAAVLASVVLIAAGMLGLAAHASAAASSVVGWGENEVGQLGNGTTVGTGVRSRVAGLGGVSSVVAGRRYSLALLSNGTVDSWGENSWGQLGNGTETGPETCHAAFARAPGYEVPCSTTPVQVKGLTGVTAIASGSQHGLALLSNGTVMAWGANGDGQLGNGTESNSAVPVPVSGLSEVTQVAAGQDSSFALLKNGTVMSWGEDGWGILGRGASNLPQDLPAPVSGLTDVTAIAVYLNTGLALLSNGTVESWGENGLGELGNGTLEESEAPVPVSGLTGVRAIARGEDSVALLENGTVMAWGSNISGQLGIGTMAGPTECALYNFCATTPVQVEGLAGVSAIAAGNQQNLALLSDGQVMAWGEDSQGQLGDGNVGSTDTPTAVSGLEDATAIAAGENFSLAYGLPVTPPPSVAQVSPHRGTPAGGTSVTIEGTNFSEVEAVDFGVAAATSYKVNSETSITAVAPAGTGGVDVLVKTPAGTSATSPADRFTYGPTITGLEPGNGPSAGGTSVTITGSGFTGTTGVSFGSTAATSFTVNSDGSITAVAPAGRGTVEVEVTTPSGASPPTWADEFTYKGPTPTIESVSVSEISEHDATLEAQIDPNGLATTYQFRLGKGCYPAACQVISEIPLPVEDLPGSEGAQTVKLDLNSVGVQLQPDSVYYYSVAATNAAGETGGNERIFRTPPEPGGENGGTGNGGAETGGASNISDTGATLSGVVTAWGWREATYVFEYGTSTSYGQSVPTPAGVIGGRVTCGLPCGPPYSERFPVSESLTELAPDTTYHYRLVSTSSGHTSYGADSTFTTSSQPPSSGGETQPSIDSESVSNIGERNATLEAQIDPNGRYTGYEFQIDTTGSFDFSGPVCPFSFPGDAECDAILASGETMPGGVEPKPQYLAAATGAETSTLDLASIGVALEPGTSYHYRVIATHGGAATVDGPDQTFTTTWSGIVHPLGNEGGARPATTGSPTGSPGSSALLPASLGNTRPTRAQKLGKALKQCQKEPKGKRVACERRAKRNYALAARAGKGSRSH
jgi:alpha-tubulin suppressor-like RCC1 family protein